MLSLAGALDSGPVESSGQIHETRKAAQHDGGLLNVQSHLACYPRYVIYQLQRLTGQDWGAVIWSVQMHERPGDGAAPHFTAGACKRELGSPVTSDSSGSV
jgi:hypothetical protein